MGEDFFYSLIQIQTPTFNWLRHLMMASPSENGDFNFYREETFILFNARKSEARALSEFISV